MGKYIRLFEIQWNVSVRRSVYNTDLFSITSKKLDRRSVLSPVQTVMIFDHSFNYQARLDTNYHALPSSIIDCT